jgi:hypothetical protein
MIKNKIEYLNYINNLSELITKFTHRYNDIVKPQGSINLEVYFDYNEALRQKLLNMNMRQLKKLIKILNKRRKK